MLNQKTFTCVFKPTTLAQRSRGSWLTPMRRLSLLSGVILAAAVMASLPAKAQLIDPTTFVPPGLSPGDQYRLVFLTSGVTPATDPNISFYNSLVEGDMSLANGANQGLVDLNWRAIAATFNQGNAQTNTSTSPVSDPSVPIYAINGVKVADSYLDFWDGSLNAPINVRPNGTQLTAQVWTGMTFNGNSFFPLGQAPGETTGFGNSSTTDSTWAFAGNLNNTNDFRLYGISDTITAVPEPLTMISSALALTGGGAAAWRRRKLAQSQAESSQTAS